MPEIAPLSPWSGKLSGTTIGDIRTLGVVEPSGLTVKGEIVAGTSVVAAG